MSDYYYIDLCCNLTVFLAASYLIPQLQGADGRCHRKDPKCMLLRAIYGLVAVGAGGAFFSLLLAGRYLPVARTTRTTGVALLMAYQVFYYHRHRLSVPPRAVWGFLAGLLVTLAFAVSGRI